MRAGSSLFAATWLATFALTVGCHADPKKEADALGRADAAATKLGGTLRTKMTAALEHGGPARAVEICAGEAQKTREEVAREAGVKIGRSSLRLRTPADVAPDWVAAWLKANGGRKAEKVTGVRAVVETPSGKVARVLRPITMEAPCLACHGDEAQIDPAVLAAIRAKYPTDVATGYQFGDLRGALWVEAAVQ